MLHGVHFSDGNDSMEWHSDNEKEFGIEPTIASISFGGMRTFKLQHKDDHKKILIQPDNGSFLLVRGKIQEL